MGGVHNARPQTRFGRYAPEASPGLRVLAKSCCHRLGVERSTYSNYELGKVSPDLDTLRRLAQIYAVPLEAFLYPEEYRTIEAARQRPPKKINSSPGRIGELSSQEKELIALLRAGIITV